MATGLSLLLIAAGAIIALAIDYEVAGGVQIETIGIILVVVGVVGLVFSLLFMTALAGNRESGHGH